MLSLAIIALKNRATDTTRQDPGAGFWQTTEECQTCFPNEFQHRTQ